MIKEKAVEPSAGQTVDNMSVTGKQENNMVKEHI
jgi:hypothetical protein